jgi:hypothetical protein
MWKAFGFFLTPAIACTRLLVSAWKSPAISGSKGRSM